jgi:hypothetical protein
MKRFKGNMLGAGMAGALPLEMNLYRLLLHLDYTFAVGAKNITTGIYDVGFKGDKFRLDVFSDHKPLLSRVFL